LPQSIDSAAALLGYSSVDEIETGIEKYLDFLVRNQPVL
jgi:hypothetical protein